jgi:hypothetical protein
MRLALVVFAALVAAPAAWAHAEVSPTVIHVDKATELTLHVPTESEITSTARVTVMPPPGIVLSGQTTWTGNTRGLVQITLTARAGKAGDYPLHVRQIYSDGKTVDWSPVVHVEAASNDNRDRLSIAIIVAIVVAVVFALRGRRRQSS